MLDSVPPDVAYPPASSVEEGAEAFDEQTLKRCCPGKEPGVAEVRIYKHVVRFYCYRVRERAHGALRYTNGRYPPVFLRIKKRRDRLL